MSHAPGLSGMPCSGHFTSAATRLSWTTSSARSKLPRTRTRAPVSRPASSRKTTATAASVTERVWSIHWGPRELTPQALSSWGFSPLVSTVGQISTGVSKFDRSASRVFRVVDGRPDLDGAGPLFGHGDRLVEVGHIDDCEAAYDLFRLDE